MDEFLRPLMRWVNHKNAAEVLVNRFGEVIVECHGEDPRPIKDPALTQEYFERLARMLSNKLEIKDFEKKPILATKLPGGHRLQLNIGSFVLSGIALSVRVASTKEYRLDDYACSPETVELLTKALVDGLNIVISGGTFSGKTQFMNALGKFIPDKQRLLTAEDVDELKLDHVHNLVRFVVNRLSTREEITYRDVIDSMTRMRPDRIWVGEMSIQNTWILLRLLDTGHAGLLTTIHADCPAGVFDAIERNIQLAGFDRTGVRDYFMNKIDLVVQIRRRPGTHVREVSAIHRRGDDLSATPSLFH
jgi:type IV secretion system protein VirB11|nr:ATPase, T2SS/T4P/T4SS family [uncultured Dongia sp.]